ncbi:hypothetical protein MW887_002218 [Aspergillus wentii]|nr:hypothetical protein MW887_002218 [Aspergillus wentii]
MSSPDKTRKQLRSKFKTLTSWYNELREKHVFLAQQPDEHLTDAHLTHLEIQLSSLDFETGQVSSTIPHFFLPATQERIENTWNAGSDGASIQDHHFSSSGFCQDYSWGCNLMREVAGHHWTLARCHSEPWAPIGISQSSTWAYQSGNRQYSVGGVFDIDGISKSHRILHLTTDCVGDDSKLTASEVMAMLDFMLSEMGAQITETKRAFDRREVPRRVHFIYPGHFDGALKIQCTKLHNFDITNYKRLVKSLLRWTVPTPCGNTTAKNSLPEVSESSEESEYTSDSSS